MVYDRTPITPIPRDEVPFDCLVMACLGPLMPSKKVEYNNALALCDSNTRHPFPFPLRSLSANNVRVRISCATLYCQVRGAVGCPVVVGRLGVPRARTADPWAGVVYDRIWSGRILPPGQLRVSCECVVIVRDFGSFGVWPVKAVSVWRF